jgi:hypothetical protein
MFWSPAGAGGTSVDDTTAAGAASGAGGGGNRSALPTALSSAASAGSAADAVPEEDGCALDAAASRSDGSGSAPCVASRSSASASSVGCFSPSLAGEGALRRDDAAEGLWLGPLSSGALLLLAFFLVPPRWDEASPRCDSCLPLLALAVGRLDRVGLAFRLEFCDGGMLSFGVGGDAERFGEVRGVAFLVGVLRPDLLPGRATAGRPSVFPRLFVVSRFVVEATNQSGELRDLGETLPHRVTTLAPSTQRRPKHARPRSGGQISEGVCYLKRLYNSTTCT